MPQNLSAQIVRPSPKVWDFIEKRLHWAFVVRDASRGAGIFYLNLPKKSSIYQIWYILCTRISYEVQHSVINIEHVNCQPFSLLFTCPFVLLIPGVLKKFAERHRENKCH